MVIVVAAAVVVNATGNFGHARNFALFKETYKRQYASSKAEAAAFEVFKTNAEKAAKLEAANKAAGGDAKFGMSPFMDLTENEFKARYLMPKGAVEGGAAELPVLRASNVGALPKAYDWRDHKPAVITPVKNQGQCGSCWAFSAVSEVESMWALAGHELVVLSEQQVVDCDTTDDGCNGGDTISAYHYIEKAGGLVPEKDYPYTARDGKCKDSVVKKDAVAKIMGYNYATSPSTKNETQLAANLMSTGPVSICVDASSWQTYTSGILSHCGKQLDHCVQITGWGTSGSEMYWWVRNSWATSWGMSGYIQLKFGQNTCGLADEATIVTINTPGTHTSGTSSGSSSSGGSSSGSTGYTSSGSGSSSSDVGSYSGYSSYGADRVAKPDYTSSSSTSSL
ncbi:cruzipain [Thecamonas trahens ATCC 50062]|uniref:Cruzipain n=1 Tax=Thecamonas trahens ATCC 50062 TaxID=461836 RepID=A0A0L0D125_THETB|nr:cruzipain [Thecamonas trahens ATCC 50062]KNC45942.1 cruzipain [Thecamonas trahens ATCC 50062]|eukprot:XP_013762925.1 cruzipain [Thecamonas trahens ATCC 50062]